MSGMKALAEALFEPFAHTLADVVCDIFRVATGTPYGFTKWEKESSKTAIAFLIMPTEYFEKGVEDANKTIVLYVRRAGDGIDIGVGYKDGTELVEILKKEKELIKDLTTIRMLKILSRITEEVVPLSTFIEQVFKDSGRNRNN